jgi:hypothetical protein
MTKFLIGFILGALITSFILVILEEDHDLTDEEFQTRWIKARKLLNATNK